MTAITLTLPYPISANRYWRPIVIKGRSIFLPTKEAKQFKDETAQLCRIAGIRAPLVGRVAIDLRLYPAMPKDWQKRLAKEGANWDDSVRCIDLDNANKVVMDALNGVAIEDDKWVRRLTSERMVPDGKGDRVEVTITPMQEQIELAPTPADLFAGVAVHNALAKEPF